jgi:hypothetical protein
VIDASGVGGRGVRVKKRRLLSVNAGSYGGGYIVVVNCKVLVTWPVGVSESSSSWVHLTLDSKQFFPTPADPTISILIVGLSSIRRILKVDQISQATGIGIPRRISRRGGRLGMLDVVVLVVPKVVNTKDTPLHQNESKNKT